MPLRMPQLIEDITPLTDQTVPIEASPTETYRAIYAVALPPLLAGDRLEVTSQNHVTNDAFRPDADDVVWFSDLLLSPDNGDNRTGTSLATDSAIVGDEEHHGLRLLHAVKTFDQELRDYYAKLVNWHQHPSATGAENMTDPDNELGMHCLLQRQGKSNFHTREVSTTTLEVSALTITTTAPPETVMARLSIASPILPGEVWDITASITATNNDLAARGYGTYLRTEAWIDAVGETQQGIAPRYAKQSGSFNLSAVVPTLTIDRRSAYVWPSLVTDTRELKLFGASASTQAIGGDELDLDSVSLTLKRYIPRVVPGLGA